VGGGFVIISGLIYIAGVRLAWGGGEGDYKSRDVGLQKATIFNLD
jgi:hypothetical protein